MKTPLKKTPKKTQKRIIKHESSFTGSVTEHIDGSIFMFIDVKNNDGSVSKSVSLTKTQFIGIKKFLAFLDIG